jgi:hypothetical protein
MIEEESSAESSGSERGNGRHRGGIRWADVALSACLQLAVSVPTMAIEESWHGRPMIDQPSSLWLVAAGLVALAFLVGGAVAGYRLPSAPVVNGAVAATIAVAVLVVGALIRRFWFVHEGVPLAVAVLWCFGAAAALLLSAAGSELGRWLAPDSR